MQRNMSNADRIIRVVIAAIFAYLYFAGIVTGFFGLLLMVFAGVFLATSLMGFCPLYVPFKINTNR